MNSQNRLDLREALKKVSEFEHFPSGQVDNPDALIFEKAFFLEKVLPVIAKEGAECLAYCPETLISAVAIIKRIMTAQKIGENVPLISHFARLQCLAALAALTKNNTELAKQLAGIHTTAVQEKSHIPTLPIHPPDDLERKADLLLEFLAHLKGAFDWKKEIRENIRSYKHFYEETGRATAVFWRESEGKAFPVSVLVRSIPSESAGNLWYRSPEFYNKAEPIHEISNKVAVSINSYLRKIKGDTYDFSDRDWIWEVTNGDGTIIEYFDGESVELALFCAVLSLIERTPIPREFAFTGQIAQADEGTLGAVSHTEEKLQAASLSGAKLFFYPAAHETKDSNGLYSRTVELKSYHSCFEVWAEIRRLVQPRMSLFSAIKTAFNYSDYIPEKNREISRKSRYKINIICSLGFAMLIALDGITTYVGGRVYVLFSLAALMIILGACLAGIGLFISALLVDVAILLGKRNNLTTANSLLVIAVLTATLIMGCPYWGLPASTWDVHNSELFPGVPAQYSLLKNAFFFFLWGALLYLPQMHFCAGLEELAAREGLTVVKPYVHFPPCPSKPLAITAPWFYLFWIGLVIAVLTTMAEFVYLIGIGRQVPMSAGYWACLWLRDIWFAGLAVFHITWFFGYLERIRARGNLRG